MGLWEFRRFLSKRMKQGWLSGLEMDSYKSQILDGVLMGSGTKTKSYEPVSQIECISVSIFWY